MTDAGLPPTSSQVLVGRGSLYTLSTVAQAATTVLVLPALTRILTTSEFGEVTAAVIVAQMLGLIGSLGMPAAITRAYFLDQAGPAGASRLVLDATGIAAATCSIGGALFFVWAPRLGFDEAMPVLLAAMAGIALAITFAGQAYLRASDQVARFLVLSGGTALFAPTVGLSALAVDRTATAYVLGWSAAQAVVAGVALILTTPGRRRGSPGLLGRALRIAVPTIPHVAAIYLLNVADRFVVQAWGGFDSVGRYQVAYLIGGAGIVVLNALNNAWAPLVFKADDLDRPRVLSETTRTVESLTAHGVVALAMASPWLLSIAAPSTYEVDGLIPVVATIALAAMPMVVYLANAHLVFVSGRTSWLAMITPAVAVLNVVLASLLLPVWGLLGAGIATVAAYGALAVGIAFARRRVAPNTWAHVADARAWTIAVAGAVGGALLPADDRAAVTVRCVLLATAMCLAVLALRRLRGRDSDPTRVPSS